MALVCWLVTFHSPLVTSSRAATITGPILKADSTPYVGTILFRPLSTPLPIAPSIVTGGDFKVSTDTDGVFSVNLQAGDYRVIIGADKGFLIDVPNDSATYTLISRITTALVWNSAIVPSTNLYATATSSTEGILKTYSTVGAPVVFTTNDLPTMGSYLTRHLITSAYTTMATLKAATVPSQNKQRIFVGGLATDGDGGGGWFTYDSTNSITSDGYMVVAPNSGPGRYLRVYGQEINPLWFGADPTGVTDSTTALQAALDFARNPTYWYGATSGETAQSTLAVVVPSGSYMTTSTLYVNGVEFRGKRGAIGGDFGAHTVFHSKHGGHFMLIDLVTCPTNGASYVGDMFITGYAETYQTNKKSLAFASTNRLQIKVADADAPSIGSEVPRASYAFFYDDQGRYLGSGRVDSTSSSGGITTCFMQTGTDVYSTVSTGGGFLRATDKVVFSPLITDNTGPSGSVGTFIDPASAGACAIYIRNTHATAFLPAPVLENIYASRFHVGLRIGPAIVGGRMGNLIFVNNRFAGIACPRDFNTTDFHFTGQIYLSGLYRSDYGTSYSNTIDNPALSYGTFGWWQVPVVSKIDQLLSEENAYAGVYFGRTLTQMITQLQVDGCIRYGVVAGRGYATYASPTSNGDDNWARAGQAWIRSQLAALPIDTVHTNDRAAVKVENTDITKPPFLHFNSLAITDPGGGAVDFDAGFSIPAGANNRVSVTALIDRNGAQSALWKSGTQQPEIGRPWVYSAADAVNGWYWDGTGWTYAANSTKTLSMASGQLTVTSGNGTAMLVLTNTLSTNAVAMNVGTRNLSIDDSANGTRLAYFSNSGSTVDWIMGNILSSGAARSSTLYGEAASGTDAAAGSMVLVASRGTGASTTGGDWDFYVPTATTSGTTLQNVARTFRVRRGGQINLGSMASAPTLGVVDGDLYYDSSVPGLRVRQSGAWVTLGAAGSGGVVDGDKGDITASASGTTWTIDPGAVTYAKMQDVSAASKLLGRGSASGAGDVEEITLGTGLQLTGTVLQATIGAEIQAWDSDLAALAALATSADKVPYFTGSSTAALADFTSFGRTLAGSANASAARASLGVAIGSQVQAYDADLAALAGVTSAADKVPYFTGSGAADVSDLTPFSRSVLAAPDAATARAVLGVTTNGTVASVSVTTTNGISGTVNNAMTTPAISLTLGAITPTSVNGVAVSGSSTPTLAVTGTTSVSGVNTGDQTSVSGNAGTATALQTARTINGVSFDGTSNITVPAAAGTLTGTTLASGVTASSLTSFGSAPTLGTPAQVNLANATNLPITTGVAGLGTGVATALATPSSANIASAVTDETGSGALVFATSPNLTTPSLGAATATSINGTTIPSSKTLVVTTDKLSVHAATTSAELAGVLSDETGTGAAVFAASPTLVTPALGVATATSVNGTTIPSSKTLVVTTDKLSVHAATTSAELAAVLSDETGTGAAVFATNPTLTTQTIIGTSSTDGPTLGSEFLGASGWTSTGWTGSWGSGWTHTPGTTTALTQSTAAASATRYQITYTVTGRTAGTFDISFGGVSTTGLSATGAWGPTTTSTASLSVTPTSTFDGTIVLSIKAITTPSSPNIALKSSDGTTRSEWRASSGALGNDFIGNSAGRYTTTGGFNVSVGYNSMLSNTTGSENVALGYVALQSNTSGRQNTAIGYAAEIGMTTGSYNTGVGYAALFNTTTALYNTAIGFVAMYGNITGAYNVAIGANAGRFTAGGSTPLTTVGTSVFVGYDSRANADGDSNEIAIGYQAIGAGSNTATLGNTSITKTMLRGAVNIGTGPAILTGPSANTLQIGDADTASPSAQTVKFQSVISGTSNTAGPNATIKAPASTGNAAGGSLNFQVTSPGSSGTSQNTWADAFTLAGDANKTATFAGVVKLKAYTVATLPAAGTAGRIAYVTDATAPTYRGALTGGGAVTCLVFDNGTSWESH